MVAVLVIDMPKSCTDCKYCGFEQFTHNPACVICESNFGKDEDIENNRSIICPLKLLPHKKMPKQGEAFPQDMRLIDRWRGWNACIDEILGETE